MKYIFALATIFLFLGHSSQAYSREFTHFKLNKLSEEASEETDASVENILIELEGDLQKNSTAIGEAEVNRIVANNESMGNGVLNFSGFSWYRPMPNFEIAARRELSPEIYSDKWIVRDTFTIFIDAATFLTNLRNDGTILITDESLELFVGVNFKRKYHYYHYANSYNEGLRSDFSKLFLSFLKFNPTKLFALKDSEIVKREDTLNIQAKGQAFLPITSGLSLGASASGSVVYKNEFAYQHIDSSEASVKAEEGRLSLEQELKKEASAELSLELDFFGLLRETLLKYELSYDLTTSNKTYLKFSKQAQASILKDEKKKQMLKSYIKGRTDVTELKDYLVSTEERKKENLSSRFGFLIYGRLRNKATEQVRIVKNGIEKLFFKLNAESVTYYQSWLSRLWGRAFYHIFKWETYIAHKQERKKRVNIEYEQTSNIFDRTESEQTLSVNLTQSIYLNKVTKNKHRKAAIKHLKLLTNLTPSLMQQIEDKKVIGPLRINAELQLRTMALYYFNHLEQSSAYTAFFNICGVEKTRVQDLLDEGKRESIFRGRMNSSLRCARATLKRYDEYMSDYIEKQNIDIKKLKNLITYLFRKVDSYQNLTPLFGEGNTFIHGSFSARTANLFPVKLFFRSGQFQEFGVIDRFKQK